MIKDKEIVDLIELIHFIEQVSTKITGIYDESIIFKKIRQEFTKLKKYVISIYILSEDKTTLKVVESSFYSNKEKIKEGEQIAKFKLKEFKIKLSNSKIYSRAINGETLQIETEKIVRELVPELIASSIISLFNYRNKKSILTPIYLNEEIIGVFSINSHTLSKYQIPSVKNLVKHISNAIELSRIYNKLNESEKKYRTLVEDMPVLMCRFKPDGELTFINKAYCDYFNKKETELIGKNFFLFIPEKEREKVKKHYQSLSKRKPFITYEHKVIAKDGSIRWQQWTDRVLFFKGNKVEEFQSIGIDITKIKEYEEKIKKLNFAIEQSNDCIVIGNFNGFVEYANKAFLHIYGFSQKQLINKEIKVYRNKNEYDKFNLWLKQLKKDGSWHGEVILSKGDGKKINGYMSTKLIYDENKNSVNYLSIVNDITQLVQQRQELENKNIALKEILSYIELEKKSIKDTIAANIEKIIVPTINAFKHYPNIEEYQKKILDDLMTNIRNITSSVKNKVIDFFSKLSSRETEICNMVKNGLKNREIAKTLNISISTVENHKRNIRKKIGISKQPVNLRTFLQRM